MTTDKLRMTIRLTQDIKDKFEMLQERLGTGQTETLEQLLEAYLDITELSNEERKDVQTALDNSGLTLLEIAKRGLVIESRKLNTLKDKVDLTTIAPEDLKNNSMRFPGVAEERIKRCVNQLMEHNNNQPEPLDRLCITENLVAKLSGSNRPAIRNYFEKYKLTIDDHNNKYGLTFKHNRKSTGEELFKSS